MTVMPVGEIMLMTLMVHPNVLRAWALGEHEEKPFMVLSVLTSVLSNDLPKSADEVTALDRSLPTCPSTRQLLAWPLTHSVAGTQPGDILEAQCGRQEVAPDARPQLRRPAGTCDQVLP